ncbi:MAG: cyclic nucleotide-binding/CBS domain-containing protein [Candidatus Bathyarchaeia archaeon]
MSDEDTVAHIMTSPVKTINASDRLGSAAEVMVMNEIGAVVVIEGTNLIGIVTERDIVKQVVGASDVLKKPVKQVLVKSLITVEPGTTIQEAFATMLKNKIRRLPVVDGSKLVGIVTDKDLMRWALRVCYEPNIPPHIKAVLEPC